MKEKTKNKIKQAGVIVAGGAMLAFAGGQNIDSCSSGVFKNEKTFKEFKQAAIKYNKTTKNKYIKLDDLSCGGEFVIKLKEKIKNEIDNDNIDISKYEHLDDKLSQIKEKSNLILK